MKKPFSIGKSVKRMKKKRYEFPVWYLPPETPRPEILRKLSRGSSSSSMLTSFSEISIDELKRNEFHTIRSDRLSTVNNNSPIIDTRQKIIIKPEIHHNQPKKSPIINSPLINEKQTKDNRNKTQEALINRTKCNEIVSINVEEAVKIRIDKLLGINQEKIDKKLKLFAHSSSSSSSASTEFLNTAERKIRKNEISSIINTVKDHKNGSSTTDLK